MYSQKNLVILVTSRFFLPDRSYLLPLFASYHQQQPIESNQRIPIEATRIARGVAREGVRGSEKGTGFVDQRQEEVCYPSAGSHPTGKLIPYAGRQYTYALLTSICIDRSNGMQGLFTMMEKDIKVSGRAKDLSLVQSAAKSAAAAFEKEAGFAVKVEVDGELAAGSYVVLLPALSRFFLSSIDRILSFRKEVIMLTHGMTRDDTVLEASN